MSYAHPAPSRPLGLRSLLMIVLLLAPAASSAFALQPASQIQAPIVEEAVPEETRGGAAETPEAGLDATDATEGGSNAELWRPAVASLVGVLVILGLMIGLKAHAFVALIIGSLVISCFVPLDYVGKDADGNAKYAEEKDPKRITSRVNAELGASVAKIGILIAMAAIIGQSMLDSGAADRIVQTIVGLLGANRAALALMISGFVLGIPVFFDTVFFLLVPLARSLYASTRRNYVKYLMAVAAGGAVTHTLVPPTPGPLIVVETLSGPAETTIDLGFVIIIGIMVGFPSAVIGLLFSSFVDRKMPIAMRPLAGEDATSQQKLAYLPPFAVAILPVLLPVLLITISTVADLEFWWQEDRPAATAAADPAGGVTQNAGVEAAADQPAEKAKRPAWVGWVNFLGDPPFALILAAITAVTISGVSQRRSLRQLASDMDKALLSGGVIILITAAGGAFGALLREVEIDRLVKAYFQGEASGGLMLLAAAYVLAAALKIAQGSSTVAMIIASSLVAPLIAATPELGFHPAYFVPVIGAGSLMGSWMNDSGFWVFAKMGGLTEGETLRSWTMLLGVLSLSAFTFSMILSQILPLV